MTLESLKLALYELEGFARRNDERAEKAVEAARTRLNDKQGFIEALARHHEAHRIYLVVRERVQEALA